MPKPLSIIVAGSTKYTLKCAISLQNIPGFRITAVITPSPKPVGRKQILTKNPLHAWADEEKLPTVLINQKIDTEVQQQLTQLPKPDFLLVVDFGYFIPDWLLSFPKLAPVNVHPSQLPRWRGSSPGQFAILFAEQTSAVTVMIVNQKMDQGAILKQIPLQVGDKWTQQKYYEQSFELASQNLPLVLENFANHKITPQPQPEKSPTPAARRLGKADSFVPWSVISGLMQGAQPNPKDLSELMQTALPHHKSMANLIEAGVRAFSGWPGVWTEIPTQSDGQTASKRMKILEVEIGGSHETGSGNTNPYLILKTVHIAGHEKPASWNQVKTALLQD